VRAFAESWLGQARCHSPGRAARRPRPDQRRRRRPAGNEERIARGSPTPARPGADLVLFGECAVTGYPAEDLLLREHFLRDARRVVDRLAEQAQASSRSSASRARADVYNSAAGARRGRVQGIYRKRHLPNYGVFDEMRYFQAGTAPAAIAIGDTIVGLTICEDIWQPGPPPRPRRSPARR
jgi:NAD+ synthase (glutamine-hydrolysing)